jgi:hypothetical protein
MLIRLLVLDLEVNKKNTSASTFCQVIVEQAQPVRLSLSAKSAGQIC